MGAGIGGIAPTQKPMDRAGQNNHRFNLQPPGPRGGGHGDHAPGPGPSGPPAAVRPPSRRRGPARRIVPGTSPGAASGPSRGSRWGCPAASGTGPRTCPTAPARARISALNARAARAHEFSMAALTDTRRRRPRIPCGGGEEAFTAAAANIL